MPTPAGVPVAMTSPGSSSTEDEMVSISVGMEKIRSATGAACRSSPLTVVLTHRAVTSSTSSRVTSAGPIGQYVAALLPRKNCTCRFCSSRTVMSLTIV